MNVLDIIIPWTGWILFGITQLIRAESRSDLLAGVCSIIVAIFGLLGLR